MCKDRKCLYWNSELLDCSLLPDDCEIVIKHLVSDRENQRIDGTKHGKWDNFNETGQLLSRGNYVNGMVDGFWRAWHENGKIRWEGHYFNGKQDGLWLFWNSDGDLIFEEIHKNEKGVKQ